ncbi:MAG: SDR family oxidoreductase [Planctomycetota bacterium]|nr:SDR family oxidoreductase [Planctomycetota bacterium]
MKWRDKVVVVTGAGGGIGRALVLDLLGRGAHVAALDLSKEGLLATEALAHAGPRLSSHPLDVTDRDAVHALPDDVLAAHGQVDAIINNAGIIQPFTSFAELDYATIDRVVQVNLYGVIHVTKAFLPHLLTRPEAHIVNVSSMGGFMPFPGQTMYGAAKAGVKLLTEGLYAELLSTTVGVSLAMPGAVATDIIKNSGAGTRGVDDTEDAPLDPLPPEEAARIILDGAEANKLHILVGKDARLLDLLSRIAPESTTRMVAKRLKER